MSPVQESVEPVIGESTEAPVAAPMMARANAPVAYSAPDIKSGYTELETYTAIDTNAIVRVYYRQTGNNTAQLEKILVHLITLMVTEHTSQNLTIILIGYLQVGILKFIVKLIQLVCLIIPNLRKQILKVQYSEDMLLVCVERKIMSITKKILISK